MEDTSSHTPFLSKKQQKRARGQAKQQRRQERARKKRVQRRQQQAQVNVALRTIGATLEKGGKQVIAHGRRVYVANWCCQQYHFSKLGEISRWAKQMRSPQPVDWAEREIERFIAQAQREFSE